MNSTKKERDPTTARTVQEVHFTSGTPLVPIHQRLSFGVVRHPCARILGERAAADVRPHAAREEQQGDTYYKHLHHFEAPCRTHNVHVPEMFPALRSRSGAIVPRKETAVSFIVFAERRFTLHELTGV